MSAVIIWIILKVLFWIGVGAVTLYFLFFTEDGRELLKWINNGKNKYPVKSAMLANRQS